MSKGKRIILVLLSLGVAGLASAVEVINIDLNGYENEAAYTGTAAFDDGGTPWHAFYGGWGTAMGSPRSKDLIAGGGTAGPSTYARQVWIGDAGDHGYVSGTGLLDDGFVKSIGASHDPNVTLMGRGAYGGVFDVYVYGNTAGSFTLLENDGKTQTTKGVTGTTAGFVEGENYVIFSAVSIGEPNAVLITYSNQINAIQLVSLKEPVAVSDGIVIDARNYDVAYDTNARTGPGSNQWGPDIGVYVHYLDRNEYMDYDITVDAASQGQYEIAMGVTTNWSAMSVDLYLDGILLGTVTSPQRSGDNAVYVTDNAVVANLFEGSHILKWKTSTAVYGDIVDLRFTYLSEITMETCEDVYTYGLNLAGDITGDCRVDIEDLAVVAADWARNNDPEAQ
jgi:hypothetical protein